MTDSSKAKSLGGVASVCRSLLVQTNIYTLVHNQMIRRNTLPAAEVLNKTYVVEADNKAQMAHKSR